MVDWKKPLETNNGLRVNLLSSTPGLNEVEVCGNSRLEKLVYIVSGDGKASTLIGPDFDIRNSISRKEKIDKELQNIFSPRGLRIALEESPELKKLLE